MGRQGEYLLNWCGLEEIPLHLLPRVWDSMALLGLVRSIANCSKSAVLAAHHPLIKSLTSYIFHMHRQHHLFYSNTFIP